MRAAESRLSELGASMEGLAPAVIRGGIIAGIVGLGAAVVLALVTEGGFDRMFQSYLAAFAFLLTISLGALFFVMLQHLVRAGWSVVIRRVAETMAMNLPLMALFFLPLLFGLDALYSWVRPEAATDPLIRAKSAYLNQSFFLVRWLVFFVLWSLLAFYFWRRSTAQDRSGEVGLTMGMERLAAPGVVLFAVSLNFASFDLLMSIDPHWYSTIFGVYVFSGGLVGFFALLAIVTGLLQRSGRLRAVTDEHWHDVGKLVFAFTVFWAYIGFSQYMLIWYANIPEETGWFQVRTQGGWTAVSLLLLFGHFLIPFFLLLPRFVKRSPKLFGPIAVWVLLMHYVDVYWLVMPKLHPAGPPLHLLDAACVVGLSGFWLAAAAHRLRRVSLIPERDPRLAESLVFENA